MSKNNSSLYMKIIKAENNAAVIRDVVVGGLNPYLYRIIKALVGDYTTWGINAIFSQDFEKYVASPDKNYLPDTIFTFDKLVTFLKSPPKRIKYFDEKKLKELKYNDIKSDLKNAEIEFKEFDIKDLDTAGIIKVISARIDFDHSTKKLLWESLDNILELRNEFEGHLTQNLKISCTSETVIEKTTSLMGHLKESIDCLEAKIAQVVDAKQKLATAQCRDALCEANGYLAKIIDTVKSISSCCIVKDSSKKYTAENLLGYMVFAVYPDITSNKFRRFCNDELRHNHALKSDCIYTDIGTVSYLEAYALSKNESKRNEAKQILKELFEPMLRTGALEVLKLSDEDGNGDDYINVSTPTDEECFIKIIQKINGNICVITDNPFVANKVWELNTNKDLKNFSAVAVKVFNKQQVVPFYD